METVNIFSSVAAALAANAIYEIVRRLSNWYSTRTKLNAAREDEFHRALTSESLSTLGGYLDRAVGPFLLEEYAEKQDVRMRVDTFVSRLMDYIGTKEEMPSQPEPKPIESVQAESESVDPEIALVEQKLLSGPPWDALASLRRLIEIRLRDLAKQSQIDIPLRTSAGRILESLQRAELISPETAKYLQYAIQVANRGIHGIEVGADEANQALKLAKLALGELGIFEGENRLSSVFAALRHQDSQIRVAAAQALGQIGDPRSVDQLLTATRDENSAVRLAAIRSLGRVGDPQAIVRLKELLSADADEDVRQTAAKALSIITGDQDR